MISKAVLVTMLTAIVAAPNASAQAINGLERYLAVPLRTVYPNEVIKRDDFTSRLFLYNPDGPPRFVQNIENYLGQSAKITLPASQPIHISAFESRRQVIVGASLRLVYEQDGITIFAAALALQRAAIGEIIQVRNIDTGAVLTGLLEKDGIVRMRSQ